MPPDAPALGFVAVDRVAVGNIACNRKLCFAAGAHRLINRLPVFTRTMLVLLKKRNQSLAEGIGRISPRTRPVPEPDDFNSWRVVSARQDFFDLEDIGPIIERFYLA